MADQPAAAPPALQAAVHAALCRQIARLPVGQRPPLRSALRLAWAVPSSGSHARALRTECRRALAQAAPVPDPLSWAIGALAQGRLEDVARRLLEQVRGKEADRLLAALAAASGQPGGGDGQG